MTPLWIIVGFLLIQFLVSGRLLFFSFLSPSFSVIDLDKAAHAGVKSDDVVVAEDILIDNERAGLIDYPCGFVSGMELQRKAPSEASL